MESNYLFIDDERVIFAGIFGSSLIFEEVPAQYVREKGQAVIRIEEVVILFEHRLD